MNLSANVTAGFGNLEMSIGVPFELVQIIYITIR